MPGNKNRAVEQTTKLKLRIDIGYRAPERFEQLRLLIPM